MPMPSPQGSVVHQSAHYRFHVRPVSVAERELMDIAASQEAVYDRVTAALGVTPAHPLHYIFADSPEELGCLYGDGVPCQACAVEPDTIYAVYNEHDRCIGAHEDTHLIAYALYPQENALLSEGLAQHMEGTWHALPNAAQARRLLSSGQYVPPSILAANDAFWAQSANVAYPIAGAFVSFLVEQLGIAGFLQQYYTQKTPDVAELDDAFRRWLST